MHVNRVLMEMRGKCLITLSVHKGDGGLRMLRNESNARSGPYPLWL